MESQFTLFEKPEKKGIKDIGAHVPPYTECEALENSYGEYLRHCNRVKSQARLPNEILDTFRQQVPWNKDRVANSYPFLFLFMFLSHDISRNPIRDWDCPWLLSMWLNDECTSSFTIKSARLWLSDAHGLCMRIWTTFQRVFITLSPKRSDSKP